MPIVIFSYELGMTQTICCNLGARCFYRLEDWWTYELCYQKHVRQFHREKDVLTAEYLLGVFKGDLNDGDTLPVSGWCMFCALSANILSSWLSTWHLQAR